MKLMESASFQCFTEVSNYMNVKKLAAPATEKHRDMKTYDIDKVSGLFKQLS